METLMIEVPDGEVKIIKEILRKFNIRIVKSEISNIPNDLTIKTIKDSQNGIGINEPIKNVRDFISSL